MKRRKSTKKAAETKHRVIRHFLTEVTDSSLSYNERRDVITGIASYMRTTVLEMLEAKEKGIDINDLLKAELEEMLDYVPKGCKEQEKGDPEDSPENADEESEDEEEGATIAAVFIRALLSSTLMDILKEAKSRENPDSSDKD